MNNHQDVRHAAGLAFDKALAIAEQTYEEAKEQALVTVQKDFDEAVNVALEDYAKATVPVWLIYVKTKAKGNSKATLAARQTYELAEAEAEHAYNQALDVAKQSRLKGI